MISSKKMSHQIRIGNWGNILDASIVFAFALVASLTVYLTHSRADAITMDSETHDALIEQLTGVQERLKTSEVSYIPTTHRIADLLADRARLQEMRAGEVLTDGKNSPESIKISEGFQNRAKSDRLKAISLLALTENLVSGAAKSKVLLQKAHLLQMVGRDVEALKLLKALRKGPKTDEYWTATDLLADLYFKLGDYSTAKKFYLEIQRSPKRNVFSDYRIAWCSFHLGQIRSATLELERVLRIKDLDPNIKIDGARDIAMFYSRSKFRSAQIQQVSGYAPDVAAQESNLRFFADELKRIGKKKESALVKLHLIKAFPKSEEKITDRADLFEILVHVGKMDEAVKMLDSIIVADCDDLCDETSTKIQKTLRDWSDEEKTKASPALISAWVVYSKYEYAQEKPLLLAIKISQDHRYHSATLVIIARVLKMTKDKAVYESALKAQIVSAEATKVASNIEKAYKQYLDEGKDSELRKEVALGLIDNLIEQKKMAEAESFGLNQISKYNFHRHEMASRLIEIYQTTKQSEKERLFSLRMAGKDYKGKYFENYKKLTTDLVASKSRAKTATKADLGLLLDIETKALTTEEHYRLLNDSFLLALQIKEFPILKGIALKMTTLISKVNAKERSLIIEKRMLVADLELDYAGSLYWDLQQREANTPAREFRLALKGRLANKPQYKIEASILKSKKSTNEQKIWVAQQQIDSSKDPIRVIEKHRSVLLRDPAQTSRILIEALAKSNSNRVFKFAASEKSLNRTLIGTLSSRRDKVAQVVKAAKAASSINTKSSNVNRFNTGLAKKIAALKDFENQFLKREKDDVIVLVGLSYWWVLNRDFSRDLQWAAQNVKVSRNIQALFVRSLQSQIHNLDQNSVQGFEAMKNLWNTANIDSEFLKVFGQATDLQRVAITNEMKQWSAHSLSPLKEKWANLAQAKPTATSINLGSLYSSLKQDPFQRSVAQDIANAEFSRGNQLVGLFITERNRDLGGI